MHKSIIRALVFYGAIVFPSLVAHAQNNIPVSSTYVGTWKSSYGSYGGGLKLTSVTHDGVSVKGTILFQSSGCPSEKPFTGRYEDGGKTFLVNTYLGSPCGKAGLKLSWNGAAWVGKYIADYPDGGDVHLAPQ